jgi:hypothetical protein
MFCAVMQANTPRSAVYPGEIARGNFKPQKLEELTLTARRLAISAVRAIERNSLRRELQAWYTGDDLEQAVNAQMPTDTELEADYDLTLWSKEYRQLQYILTFEEHGVVRIHRSPFFTFAPKDHDLYSPLPGSRPCYALPADWLIDWRKPLFHVPSLQSKELIYAWKPAQHKLPNPVTA